MATFFRENLGQLHSPYGLITLPQVLFVISTKFIKKHQQPCETLHFITNSNAQTNENFNCGIDIDGPNAPTNQVGGKLKPYTNTSGEYLRALFVFVQFQGDTRTNSAWPLNQLPIWANDFIDTNVSSNYRDLTLSDYWSEMSQGNFDFIGDVYPSVVILPPESQYISQGKDHADANQDVIAAIDPNVNFNNYDKWSYNSTTQSFQFTPDGYVDMIYIIYRNPDYHWFWTGNKYTAAATLGLGTSFTMTTEEGKVVSSGNGWISSEGSGITVREGLRGHYNLLEICAHEYGHYLFGAHHWNYSGIMGGGTFSLSGWERERLGYVSYTNVTQNNFTITLSDFIKQGEILRVPIPITEQGSSKYFLVENHQRESSYDQIMRGGSIGGSYNFNTSLGSGIYIWKVSNGNSEVPSFEIVTADGRFDWQYVGDYFAGPGWGTDGYLPKTKRTSVNRNTGKNDRMPNHIYWRNHWESKWVDINYDTKDYELSRDVMGDEYDAFNFGYNEIFSPWSNPSSYFDGPSDISIQLYSQNGNDRTLKVYTTQSSALALAPSKPQFLKVVHSGSAFSGHPKLTWDTNPESDITSYKIYRALEDDYGMYPFHFIATVSNNPSFSTHTFIDSKVNTSDILRSLLKYHYKVKAVDNTNKESVYSDPAWIDARSGPLEKSTTINDQKIKDFKLFNSYPNPFNPSTKIEFQISQDAHVSLTVYNSLGQKVKELVNNNLSIGKYSVEFNADKLPSGLYIYKLQAGKFSSVKKMILTK